jgi:hypothetical protein
MLWETTMTRLIVFALNVMLFGLSAVLMVMAPSSNAVEQRQTDPAGAEALPSLV